MLQLQQVWPYSQEMLEEKREKQGNVSNVTERSTSPKIARKSNQ